MDSSPNECPRCGNHLVENSAGNQICPACALRAARPSSFWESQSGGLLQKFIQTSKQVLTEPAAFFRAMPTSGGVGGPLAFALIVHWLGKLGSYLWGLVYGQALFPMILRNLERIQEMAKDQGGIPFLKDRLSDLSSGGMWIQSLFGAASLALDPFFTLISLFFSTLLIFIGARLLLQPGRDGAPAEITFETILRILCYASTPLLLAFVPLVGGLLASLGSFVVLTLGVREVYRTSTGRAIGVAAFPQLLLLAVVLVLVLSAFAFFASFFGKMMG